ADLVGGEADPHRHVHRLEHVGDERAQGIVEDADLRGMLPQHRRAEQVDREDGHQTMPGVAWSPTRMIRCRSTTSCALPHSKVTRWSLMSFTLPTRPPEVVISSPFLSAARISAAFFRAWPCGRMIRK